MPRDVRTYTRRTPKGKTATVRRHTRRGDPARPDKPRSRRGPNPHHAAKLAKRSMRARRHGRKGTAAALGVLAAGEIIAWFTLSGTSLVLAAAAGVLAFASWALVR